MQEDSALQPASGMALGTADAERGRSVLHARLRRETAALHRAVEGALPLSSPELTLVRYVQVLELFLGFYEPLEERIAQFASAVPFPLRCRAALLSRDLLALGRTAHPLSLLPRCEASPFIELAQVAGCLYVLEGASLGGQVVARAVRRNLGLGPERGAAFFAGDGEATGPRWRQVLTWLDALSAQEHGAADRMVASACDTFLRLHRWVGAHHG